MFSQWRLSVVAVSLYAWPALGQVLSVPNASFEEGEAAPDAWSLSEGDGRWSTDKPHDGARCVFVSGTGADVSVWRSEPLELDPQTLYRLRFWARSVDAAGVTAVSGPVFANRDIGIPPETWEQYVSVFLTPSEITEDQAALRFGQWHVRGSIAFDEIELVRAQAVHRAFDGFHLGKGEVIEGNRYGFLDPSSTSLRNCSRPLVRLGCQFNTNRWVFSDGGYLVFRHDVGGRKQSEASVEVHVNYHAAGALAIEAGTDGETWTAAGVMEGDGPGTFPIPDALLPAREVWVRLRCQSASQAIGESAPGSFQVDRYAYSSRLDGPPVDAQGATHYVTILKADPRFEATLDDVGECVPKGRNLFRADIRAVSGELPILSPSLVVEEDGTSRAYQGEAVRGQIRIPYEITRAGYATLTFSLGQGSPFEAEASVHVPVLYETGYGAQLPGSSEQVALWWASSGWKISKTRPVPAGTSTSIAIRCARNEAEAAQLVIRPSQPLQGLTVAAGDLTGPGCAVLPASCIDVLRIRYVNIMQPTDDVGVEGPWPDPLPPLKAPLPVDADVNQPLWVRVSVPKDLPGGDYRGVIALSAEGYEAEAPLEVHVFNFSLPDRMTCTTAFGFSPAEVFRYQGVTDPAAQREVLDKYWENFRAHHISPYDPAPLDPFGVTWPSQWEGGERDTKIKHAGESSLFVADDATDANAAATYGARFVIPPNGVDLSFWYRTREADHVFNVTLSHYNRAGQWISGRNNDIVLTGSGAWQSFSRRIAEFPEDAATATLTLWGAHWREDGSTTGAVWYDEVRVLDAANGQELLCGGGFEPLGEEDLFPKFNWDDWDAAMRRAVDTYHFNAFSVPIQGLGGGSFHSRVEPNLLGYGEDTPEYKAAFRGYCQGVEQHLREKGWLDEAFVYWFDEPEPRDYEFVMKGFRKLKEAAPGLNRMLTEQVEPELVGGPNIWCTLTPNYVHEDAEPRRKGGDLFWWYVCTGPKAPYCTLFIDHAATELRVWLWQTWQRKISGVLVWQTNYWTSPTAYPDPNHPQNPYEDVMSWVTGYGVAPGVRMPWGNGDGRFVYPPEEAAEGMAARGVLAGPVDSIRWEMLRDGIEDYEYLAMLERALGERPGLSGAERRRYEALLEVPAAITSTMTVFTADPAPIEGRRDEIAAALEELTVCAP